MDPLSALNDLISAHDNSKNLVHFSNIPEICKDEPCTLGVDEAGRGPVLGPMVYGIAFCPLSKRELLKDLGCADSKSLTEEKRETIFGKILNEETTVSTLGWAIEVISPNTICNSMLRRSKYSLNEVSMDSAIGLIRKAIELRVNIAEVYVDTVGPPEKYEAKLKVIFPDFKITVAKKADSTYPIVSAASIAAKVSRDHSLKVWKFREGLTLKQESFGSGYPGDPVTKSFIRDQIDPVFGYPQLVRFSWATAKTMLDDKAFACEFDNLDEDEGSAKKKKRNGHGSKKISSFFGSKTDTDCPVLKRHTYFKERFLCLTEDL